MNLSQKPEPGDLIEVDRSVYKHWAVYVGDDSVVHVTSPPGAEVPGIVSNSLMSVPTEKAMVMKEKLQEVVGNNNWRINNSLDKKYEPNKVSTIVNDADMQVGKRMEYSVISKNCEHFATKLRYGKAESRQVCEAGEAAVATGILAGGVLALGAVVTAAAFSKTRKTD